MNDDPAIVSQPSGPDVDGRRLLAEAVGFGRALRALLVPFHNPVAVWGGADAQQPEDVWRNAPASVLTFGRAISADDYETVAARARV